MLDREGRGETGMKCLYYVAPELESTSKVADDLHDVGIDDFFVHVIAGVVGCILLDHFGPFQNIPWYVYLVLCAVATLFGAWEGGLIGVEKENKKIARFHDDIEAGKYVILIYARRDQEAQVRHLMSRRHPEAEFAGVDSHFVNPFTSVRRRRTSGDRVRA
jgi:hypothetical protein